VPIAVDQARLELVSLRDVERFSGAVEEADDVVAVIDNALLVSLSARELEKLLESGAGHFAKAPHVVVARRHGVSLADPVELAQRLGRGDHGGGGHAHGLALDKGLQLECPVVHLDNTLAVLGAQNAGHGQPVAVQVVREMVLESQRIEHDRVAAVGLGHEGALAGLDHHLPVPALMGGGQLLGQLDLAHVVVLADDLRDDFHAGQFRLHGILTTFSETTYTWPCPASQAPACTVGPKPMERISGQTGGKKAWCAQFLLGLHGPVPV